MTESVQMALIAALPSTITALGAFIVGVRNGRRAKIRGDESRMEHAYTAQKVESVHADVAEGNTRMNHRLDELIEAARQAARQEGIEIGVAQERARQGGE